MDKHNNQQKNKNKNAKKPSSPQASLPALQDQLGIKEESAVLQGKKSGALPFKKK